MAYADSFKALAQAQAFAMLIMGDGSLLVPQNQIVSLEPVMDLQRSPEMQDTVGTLRFQGKAVPIFKLDSALVKHKELDDEHRFCVIFDCQGDYFGLLCRQMQPVQSASLSLSPIPQCMRQADLLFHALAILDRSVVKLTDNLTLATYLGIKQEANYG